MALSWVQRATRYGGSIGCAIEPVRPGLRRKSPPTDSGGTSQRRIPGRLCSSRLQSFSQLPSICRNRATMYRDQYVLSSAASGHYDAALAPAAVSSVAAPLVLSGSLNIGSPSDASSRTPSSTCTSGTLSENLNETTENWMTLVCATSYSRFIQCRYKFHTDSYSPSSAPQSTAAFYQNNS